MANPIRVLVVDDSAVVRQVRDRPAVGRARHHGAGMRWPTRCWRSSRMRADWPDVVVLDVEMPRMDGITFLRKIMAERPTPVVICSTLTEKGAHTTHAGAGRRRGGHRHQAQAGPASDFLHRQRPTTWSARARGRRAPSVRRAGARPRPPASRPVRRKLNADAMLARRRRRRAMAADHRAGGGHRHLHRRHAGAGRGADRAAARRRRASSSCSTCRRSSPPPLPRGSTACARSGCKEADNDDRVLPGRALIAPAASTCCCKRSGAQYHVEVRRRPAGQPPPAVGGRAVPLGGAQRRRAMRWASS